MPFGGSLGVWGVTNLLTLNAVSANPIIIGQTGRWRPPRPFRNMS